MPDPTDVIRKNLELIVGLRDQATHLVVPEIQNTLSRLFQANVMNFVRTAEKYDITDPLISKSMGLLSLVADIRDTDSETIRLTYGSGVSTRVDEFLARFKKEEVEIGSPFYAIPIEYRFILSNQSVEGDIEISLTRDGTSARIVEIPKDPDKTHPFRLTQLMELINKALAKDGHPPLNRNDLLAVIASEKIRANKANRVARNLARGRRQNKGIPA